MKGLDRLVKLRMSGKAPDVTVCEVARQLRPAGDTLSLQHRHGDRIPADLRAVVGLRVLVAGRDDKAETVRVCEALDAAGAVAIGFCGESISAGRLAPDELVFVSDQWPT